MTDYNFNILDEAVDDNNVGKRVLINMDGMYIDRTVEKDYLPNLFFSDGTPVIKQHIIRCGRIACEDSKLYFIGHTDAEDIFRVNVINNKGELFFDEWKDASEFVTYCVDKDYKISEKSFNHEHSLILSKGMNEGRLVNKIFVAKGDRLIPFGVLGKFTNINAFGPFGSTDWMFERYCVLSSPDGVENPKPNEYRHIPLGKDFELMLEDGFTDIHPVTLVPIQSTRHKGLESENYLYATVVRAGKPTLYNLYNNKTGEFLQNKMFLKMHENCLTTGWMYEFFKFADGTCRIEDNIEMNINDNLKFIGDSFDDVFCDQDADMYVAEKDGKYYVLNGDELVECEDFRFFYIDPSVKCIRNFFFIYKDGYWRAVKLKHLNAPKYAVMNINDDDEGGFEAFDPLYENRVKVYRNGKQNVFDAERGLLFPGMWFDDINPYEKDTVCIVSENGRKYEISNVDGKIVSTA